MLFVLLAKTSSLDANKGFYAEKYSLHEKKIPLYWRLM